MDAGKAANVARGELRCLCDEIKRDQARRHQIEQLNERSKKLRAVAAVFKCVNAGLGK